MKSILYTFLIVCSTVNAQKAVAVLKTTVIHGTILFEKTSNGVSISANISDLTPEGLHGFHIHQFGDLSDGCISAGPHFNPNNYTHGSPNDTVRHVGDLGNVVADSKGTVVHHIVDHQIELTGVHSIIGRAVVVHALRDDLGQGKGDKEAESKKTGNAGGRVACGVIGISKD